MMQRSLVKQQQVPQFTSILLLLPLHPLALALALPVVHPQTPLHLQNMLQSQFQNQNRRLSKVQKNLGIKLEFEPAIYMKRLGHAFSHQDTKMASFQACRCHALGQLTMLKENAQKSCPLEWLAVSRIVGEC